MRRLSNKKEKKRDLLSIAKIKMKINTDHKAVLLIAVLMFLDIKKLQIFILFLMNPSSLLLSFSQVKAKSLQHTDCLIATY